MGVLGFNNYFEKQPSEIVSIRAEFADLASALAQNGYNMSNCDLAIFDAVGNNTGNTLISAGPTVDANNSYVYATIRAGTDGNDYYARFKTTWSKSGQPDQLIERDLKISVRQKGF